MPAKRKKSVVEEFPENSDKILLTGIHNSYTVYGTHEVDELMIKHFLNTLAEVALSIASRTEVNQ